MSEHLESLAAEFDGSAEASRELDDHGTADAWELAARRVREVAAEVDAERDAELEALEPRLLPAVGSEADDPGALVASADAGAPIYDEVQRWVHVPMDQVFAASNQVERASNELRDEANEEET